MYNYVFLLTSRVCWQEVAALRLELAELGKEVDGYGEQIQASEAAIQGLEEQVARLQQLADDSKVCAHTHTPVTSRHEYLNFPECVGQILRTPKVSSCVDCSFRDVLVHVNVCFFFFWKIIRVYCD